MIKMESYFCDGVPSEKEVQDLVNRANNLSIAIEIKWYVRYSGNYSRIIKPGSKFEDIWASIPKSYGM